jgi:hypothetical protein
VVQAAFTQSFDKYFTDGSLRFDYYRTGNDKTEIMSNDEIYKEPYWGGSHINLLDTFDYGNYKFEVYDSISGIMIYSRGYSSLFKEWRYTPEAKKLNRSFSETVIFPFPRKTVKLVFYKRKRNQSWEKQYVTYVNPKDYNIIEQQNMKLRSFKIHGSRTPEKALDIVLLSEGYTATQMQKFMDDANRFKDYLLKCSPFDEVAGKINIWVVPVESAESGTDLPGKNIWRNTVFDSHFYTFGTERYLNTTNNKKVRDAAANAPYDQIYILVNTDKYGGAGIYNYYSICTADNKYSDFVFTHEFGHAFAALGDEYYTSDVSVQDFYDLDSEPWEPNLTTLKNFDKKWKAMVEKGTPVPTPDTGEYKDKVGAFEGAGYVEKGVYRPVYDCSMKSIKYNNFCPVCTKAFFDMIEFYSN